MAKNSNQLKTEFKKIKKNWYDVYNWKSVKSKGYSELISEIISNNFSQITINSTGLRMDNFKLSEHIGGMSNNTSLDQVTEKRICRAIFNLKDFPPLGHIIDYEVPLTAPNQPKNKKQGHGDIDLIAKDNQKLLLIEAKKHKSDESILKAVLEAFTYSRKVGFRKIEFLNSYKLSHVGLKIVPAVLVFKDSASGRQLLSFNKKENQQLLLLISLLNKDLNNIGIENIEFYIINNNFINRPLEKVNEKLVFRKFIKFHIDQIFPFNNSKELIHYCNQDFNSNNKIIRDSLISLLRYYKNDGINYAINRIKVYQKKLLKLSKEKPKKPDFQKRLNQLCSNKDAKFIKTFISIIDQFPYKELVPLLINLMSPGRNILICPAIAKFENNEILKSLIHAYDQLPIESVRDMDGAKSVKYDLTYESTIIQCLCNMKSKLIVGSLKKSLLQGSYSKEIVLDKLKSLLSENDIIKYYKPIAEAPNNIWDTSDKKKNANWVLNRINNDVFEN